MANLVDVVNIKKYYPFKSGALSRSKEYVKALDGVDLDIKRGEILSLVGESGCGKSTLGRVVLRLTEPTEGNIIFDGQDLSSLSLSELRSTRKRMQIIFQDPYSSLNPRMRIADILREPLSTHMPRMGRAEALNTASALLTKVGLRPDVLNRFPHEFSGGQRQRIGIARAIALNPELIVCDEPLSALDVSIRSQVINLLRDIQKELSLTYLFISHDLSVVRYISDRVCVMYLGKVMEIGTRSEIFGSPAHPYTRFLLSSVPVADPRMRERERMLLEGDMPSPVNPPSGCRFRTRCPMAEAICAEEIPPLKGSSSHKAACHFAPDSPGDI